MGYKSVVPQPMSGIIIRRGIANWIIADRDNVDESDDENVRETKDDYDAAEPRYRDWSGDVVREQSHSSGDTREWA